MQTYDVGFVFSFFCIYLVCVFVLYLRCMLVLFVVCVFVCVQTLHFDFIFFEQVNKSMKCSVSRFISSSIKASDDSVLTEAHF
jgi:hypothetical protein